MSSRRTGWPALIALIAGNVGGSFGAGGCAAQGGALAAREGFVTPASVVQVRWRRHLTDEPLLEYKPQEFAAATYDDTHVFIGSSAGVFYALDPRDGSIVWQRAIGGAIASQPRVIPSENTVLFGAEDGGLYALDLQTGEERWVYRVKAPIESQPVYADGLVYFSTGENRVYAIDAHRGTWKWQYDRESPSEGFTIRGYSAPLVVNGRVYVGFSDGYLASLTASSGEVLWARSLAGEAMRFFDVDSTPLLYGGSLYVSSYAAGVLSLDPKDGSVRWRFDVEGAGSVRAKRGRVYFSAAKSGLHCLDTDGHLQWQQALAGGGELSTPTMVGDYVLVSSSEGGTYVADAATGRLYEYFAPGRGVTSESVSDGKQIYLLSNNGYFYALALTSGRATF